MGSNLQKIKENYNKKLIIALDSCDRQLQIIFLFLNNGLLCPISQYVHPPHNTV